MESSVVVRKRGRPRKQRREDEIVPVDPKSVLESMKMASVAFVGRYVLKEFRRSTVLLGKVVSYESGLYKITYENGGCENLNSTYVRKILLDDSYFDDELIQRKSELEESLLSKMVDQSGKGSSELHGDISVKEEEQDEMKVDSTGDSIDLSSDTETEFPLPLPLPPPLVLPQSSGTIGVPEQCVQHLFAVYGFLRSFSTRLFLSPFTLDEFVGSLNCRVANTLLDAIHVSLMCVMRRHLENLAAEGSKRASKCLRCSDWSLLDTFTWPVFVIQYLVVNGYTKGPEWTGFKDENSYGEYYLLPASRKLIILQILCDDVLDSEELKAEMNLRKESEVGMDYETEDILPAENGPRRVHPRYTKTTACKDNETMKFVSELSAVNPNGNAEGGDVDGNGDECRLCGMDGTLLCCDGCPAVYHSRCIGVMKMHIPEGAWYCPECKINMIGPTIAKGTSLKGAEIFGRDLYGQLFMGACDHLLVLNVNSGEFCLKYYNLNDIPEVLQVLYASMQHRPIYYDICMAIIQYWNFPESFLHLCATTGPDINSANTKIDANFSAALPPPKAEEDHKTDSLAIAGYNLTSISEIYSDNVVPSLNSSLLTTQGPAHESSGNARTKEFPTVNVKLHQETMMDSVVSTIDHRPDVNYQNSVHRSTVVNPAKSSLVSSQFNNYGHANDMGLPMNLSLQTNGYHAGFGKCKGSISNDFVYMGCSFKPQSYMNYYIHGHFAASAAANLAVLSSEDSRSEGHVSDNLSKATSGNTYLLAKAFSLTASRFFWPSSEKKLVEVPRERCGWCLSCKSLVSSKRGCMLNHAALSATKSAMKILSGLAPVRIGEGIIPSIVTYVIYMEESLCGLIDGPFISENYRKQWRKLVERAATFRDIKPLLLKLEENIRTIAFYGDWVKLMDDWLVEFFTIQRADCTIGTTQKRAPCGRRKKQLSIEEVKVDAPRENFTWWPGDKYTKSVFQRAVLPKSMVRKAARQGGSRKIFGIFYADEIPKRSRRLIWRAAVEMCKDASQLALQVRYLDSYIRWTDLIRPEHNLQDGKGQDTEASAFRNANVCDKKHVEGKFFYGLAFGSQKHLPSRVMKNVEIELGPEGKEKYWFSEMRIPLYLIKEYEVGIKKGPSDKEHLNIASLLHKRRLKATPKDIFFYLTCKRDKLDVLSCYVCQKGILFGNAFKCSACQGYCHKGCSINLTVSTNEEVEFLTTCKKCYYAKLLTKTRTSMESPATPLILQGQGPGQGHTSLTVPKGPIPKCNDQAQRSTRTKDSRPAKKQASSDSTRRGHCSWGIIWKKKNSEDTGIDFRLRNIILKGGSGLPQLQPVCLLCQKPYRSDLMYVCCETCRNWYHADAIELEESKIFDVLGFKCCKCRRIKSPGCPYSDFEGKKSHSRASKKEHFGAHSDSLTITDMGAYEPATPLFPVEDVSRQEIDPLLFSLSNVELVTERKLEPDFERNTFSGSGPQKLPVRRHTKCEEEDNNGGSFGNQLKHADFSTHNEMGNLSKSHELPSPCVDFGSALVADTNLLNDSEVVNYENMEFEPHTYFSWTELLNSDGNNQYDEADVSGDFSGYLKDSNTLGVPEECGTVKLDDYSWGHENSLQGSIYNCSQCTQFEPAPDLFCQLCGIWIHSQCSPWVESPSRLANWKCGNCREWQ